MTTPVLDPRAAPAAAAPVPASPFAAEAPRCTLVQRLQGGIGNQLFQVLHGQRLARLAGLPLVFDLAAYGPREAYGRSPVLQRLWPEAAVLDAAVPHDTARALREADLPLPASGPLPALPALPPGLSHLVLEGYWQDHRLAEPAAVADLRQRLERAVPPGVRELGRRIASAAQPVAVHIRRRDYAHHGLAAEGYYIDTLRWLAARGGADVFVFTDEPNYSAHFLGRAGIRAQVVASGDDLSDLYLMAQCRRHVIANSTFSWWGAVLSGSAEVVWPAPWSLVHQPSAQLCPPHWLRVAGAVGPQPAPAVPVAAASPAGTGTAGFTDALQQERFRRDRDAFFAQAPLPPGWQVQLRPCPGDDTATTTYDAHYVYHTAWAARRLLAHPVAEHVDIGSDHRFTTIASAFQPMRFLDWRPAPIALDNLQCGHGNLLALDLPDRSLGSLSCMHVVEHIGLGRYGDPLDFHGADRAMAELQRVLAPGGLLYFVVPVGQPTIVFHAHRIFRASDIVAAFGELELLEFSLVLDDGRFVERVTPALADTQRYGCGCFLFRRPPA
jgi:SAM-dependent methyltransferase